MALKPEASLMVALATGAVVWAIYQNATPSVADVRVGQPNDMNIDASRRMAGWTGAGVVGGISLLAKDPMIFIIGGAMVVAVDWWYRHANAFNPESGRASVPSSAALNGALMDVNNDATYMSN